MQVQLCILHESIWFSKWNLFDSFCVVIHTTSQAGNPTPHSISWPMKPNTKKKEKRAHSIRKVHQNVACENEMPNVFFVLNFVYAGHINTMNSSWVQSANIFSFIHFNADATIWSNATWLVAISFIKIRKWMKLKHSHQIAATSTQPIHKSESCTPFRLRLRFNRNIAK